MKKKSFKDRIIRTADLFAKEKRPERKGGAFADQIITTRDVDVPVREEEEKLETVTTSEKNKEAKDEKQDT